MPGVGTTGCLLTAGTEDETRFQSLKHQLVVVVQANLVGVAGPLQVLQVVLDACPEDGGSLVVLGHDETFHTPVGNHAAKIPCQDERGRASLAPLHSDVASRGVVHHLKLLGVQVEVDNLSSLRVNRQELLNPVYRVLRVCPVKETVDIRVVEVTDFSRRS